MQAVETNTLNMQLQMVQDHLAAGRNQQAEVLCRDLVRNFPGNPGPLSALAMIALRAGNIVAATDCMRQASRSPAATPVIFSNLCNLERQCGRFAEAVEAGRRAVSMAPNFPGPLNNLAIALQEGGNLDEALELLDRSIKLEPKNADAHSNRGNTLRLLKRGKEAEQAFNRAIKHQPRMASAHNNLAGLYISEQKWEKAQASAKKAIAIDPDFIQAYTNLAESLLAAGKSPEALKCLKEAVSRAPTNAAIYAMMARVLKDIGHYTGALKAAERAAELLRKPQHLIVLAEMLHGAGRIEDAEQAVREALAQDPNVAYGNNWLAYILLDQGKAADAEKLFEKALEKQPEQTGIYYNIAITRKFEAGDSLIGRIENEIANLDETAHDFVENSMRLHFALGKVLTDCGENDRGFEALHTGNRLKRSTIDYSQKEFTSQIDKTIKAFAEHRELDTSFSSSSNQPIFVIGMPRSGSSLIEQILASHSDVYGAGELRDFNVAVDSLRDDQGGNVFYPAQMGELSSPRLKFIADQYLGLVNERIPDTTRFTDKMPSNFRFLGLIVQAFPNAKVIHSMRSPMDTCTSCYMHLFEGIQNFTYNQEDLAHFYRGYKELMDHWRKVVPASQLLDMQYEELIDDQEGQTQRLLEFCELPWDDKCMEFYKNKRAVRTASLTQVRQPIYRTSLGKGEQFKPWLSELASGL